jgi:hypothetical protein
VCECTLGLAPPLKATGQDSTRGPLAHQARSKHALISVPRARPAATRPRPQQQSPAAHLGAAAAHPAGPAAQGAANAVHARELLAVALAALLGQCGATYVDRWARDAPAGVALAAHLADVRAALRSLLAPGQPLPPALRRELEARASVFGTCRHARSCLCQTSFGRARMRADARHASELLSPMPPMRSAAKCAARLCAADQHVPGVVQRAHRPAAVAAGPARRNRARPTAARRAAAHVLGVRMCLHSSSSGLVQADRRCTAARHATACILIA